MAVQPLTHHEIVGLVAPFARQGIAVDLAASDRMERKLVFKSVSHAGAGPAGGVLVETLKLEHTRTGRYRLSRQLVLPGGQRCLLHVDGPEPARLLAAIAATPLQRQYLQADGCVVALEQLLPAQENGAGAAPPTGAGLMLRHASTQVAGLGLNLRVPAVPGVPAELDLKIPMGDTIALPDDLLAVLGWPWSRLTRKPDGWAGVLRLKGKDQGSRTARSDDAQARLLRTIEHLQRTLAEPPSRFHERLRRQRWGVTLRRATPLLGGFALLGAAATVPKVTLEENSLARMLIFQAPPLLLVVFFSLREMPRIEVPPWPRPLTAARWRSSEAGPSLAAPAQPQQPG